MIRLSFSSLAAAIALAAAAHAQTTTQTLPIDQPVAIGEYEAACTGFGEEARTDPRWSAFPLRVEITGQGGQYLADAMIAVRRNGQEVARVSCDAPWALFDLPPGRYQIDAQVEGRSRRATALVPRSGQHRVVLRFTELGGAAPPNAAAGF